MRMKLGRSTRAALLWQLPAGLLAGMSFVYFWDHARGHARRQHVRDTVNGWIAQGRERALHKEAHTMSTTDDPTLLERVQSEIFRDSSLLRETLNVDSQAGIITLRGAIPEPARMLALVAAVQDVPGVIEVRNLLHTPETPAPNKAPTLAASHTTADQTPPSQPIPATPKEAAMLGADLAAGTVEDVPQPVQSMRTASAKTTRAKSAPAGETSKTRAAKRQATMAATEQPTARTAPTQRAGDKKRTTASKSSRTGTRTSASQKSQKGKTMQPNSDQKPTQDENVDFSELVTPQMADGVRAKNPQQGDQNANQSTGKYAQQNQSDSTQNQTAAGNDSGLPGGGVGRREEPGKTGIYPLSASQGAKPDSPIKAEGAFGQGDRGIEGYADSGDSGLLMGDEGQTDQGNATP